MKILSLTGPSCSGKTTVLNELVDKHGYQNVVSHTTRPPRLGETEGRDYYFTNEETFERMWQEGEFLESVRFNGYRYGVSSGEIHEANRLGKIAALIVEPRGLVQIMKYAKDRGDVELKKVFISGDTHELMTRYIQRMHGENLNERGVAERHAKRLDSLVMESATWTPCLFESKNDYPLDYLKMQPSYIPYDLVIPESNDENFEEIVQQIKGLHK
jgi:guanylate kinase